MNIKPAFNWQANISESRIFWEEHKKDPYWVLLTDTSYKLIDLIINIKNPQISNMEISERISTPLKTTQRYIATLKRIKILHSEKEIYSINGNIRSTARYAINSFRLTLLAKYLSNINLRNWRPSTDPFRSIMKKKSDMPSNYYLNSITNQEIKQKGKIVNKNKAIMQKGVQDILGKGLQDILKGIKSLQNCTKVEIFFSKDVTSVYTIETNEEQKRLFIIIPM